MSVLYNIYNRDTFFFDNKNMPIQKIAINFKNKKASQF